MTKLIVKIDRQGERDDYTSEYILPKGIVRIQIQVDDEYIKLDKIDDCKLTDCHEFELHSRYDFDPYTGCVEIEQVTESEINVISRDRPPHEVFYAFFQRKNKRKDKPEPVS